MQGYYIGRPDTAQAIGETVASGRTLIRPASAKLHERPVVVGKGRLYY